MAKKEVATTNGKGNNRQDKQDRLENLGKQLVKVS